MLGSITWRSPLATIQIHTGRASAFQPLVEDSVPSPTDAWALTALCTCGQPWSNHEVLEDSVVPSAPGMNGPQPPFVPPPLASLQASLPNPVRAFTGLTSSGSTSSSGSASANENRNAAMARHFPRPKYKPPRPYPTSTAAVSTFQVVIALWPNVIPGSAAADDLGSASLIVDFAYTIDQFTEMILRLKAHHLVFVATLPSTDQSNIIQELSSQLSANLLAHNLVLPAGPGDSTNGDSTIPWFRLPWMVLEPTRRKAVYTFGQHAKVNANNFNRKMILDINSKFVNPDIEHTPRFANVRGSLPPTLSAEALDDASHPEQLHSCFGHRLLYGLPHSGNYRTVECLGALCPDEDLAPVSVPLRPPRQRERTPAAMVASTSQIRSRPASLTPPPPSHRRRLNSSSYIEVLSSDDEDFVLPLPLAPRRTNPPRNTRLPIVSDTQLPSVAPAHPPTQIRLAAGSEISDWQRSVWIEVASVPDSQTVRIKGANITAISEFIIALFYHLRMKQVDPSSAPPFPRPAAINYPRTGMTHLSFLQSEMHRSYYLASSALGRGVEQAVWRHVLSLLAEDTRFWQPTPAEPQYFTFLLSPVSSEPERTAKFYVYGQLIAIHLYYYGHGLSVGLWPVLAIALGRASMLLGEGFLRLISPDVASDLRPWFALAVEDPMPSSLTAPVSRLLMDVLEIQPSQVPFPRSPTQHDDITVRLLSRKLLGRDGFDMSLSDYANFGDHLRTLLPLQAACLIAGMYRRQIQNLQDVALMRSLFELRFKRYLTGDGHPQQCRDNGLVATDEEMQRGSTTPFLRAQLLLLTAIESSLLPVKDTWGIRFMVSDHIQPGINVRPHSEALPLQFHTCTGGVEVRVNAILFDMMIKSPRGDEDTEFDVWMHTQIYNADLAYNRI
ncbi:hypothetical protein DFH08DRAFT_973733 [Mycena albidolilacea]|uniref:Uncharacterized protein n=1 Tax=Mycena albidolilacea TaxID=1033008 RepID=A0AAD6Z8S0_9AGAR|nr:hypothetical protein DFH08DRAFT_973733 [Mycena albidolilacea]